jgi:hypothetical protein
MGCLRVAHGYFAATTTTRKPDSHHTWLSGRPALVGVTFRAWSLVFAVVVRKKTMLKCRTDQSTGSQASPI